MRRALVGLAVTWVLAARPAAAQVSTNDPLEGIALGTLVTLDLGLTVNNAVNDTPRSKGVLVGELALVTPQYYFALAAVRAGDWPEQPLGSIALYWLAALEIQSLVTLFPPRHDIETRPDAPLRIGGALAIIQGCGGGCALDDLGAEVRLFVDRRLYRRVIGEAYLATGVLEANPDDTGPQHVRHVEAGVGLKLGIMRFGAVAARLVGRLGARVQHGASDDRWTGLDPTFGVGFEIVLHLARTMDLVAGASYEKIGLDAGRDAGIDSVSSTMVGLAF